MAEDTQAGPLVDGGTPAGPDDLFRRLDELGLGVHTIEHPPVVTVDQAKQLRGHLEGGHTKNLFLRDKRGRMWLVVCLEDTAVDLKTLQQRLESGRLSFGSADRLSRYLGVVPGAVTPFAAMNDTTGAVRVVLDRRMMDTHAALCFHPLTNAMTTTIGAADLVTFLEAVDHPPATIDVAPEAG